MHGLSFHLSLIPPPEPLVLTRNSLQCKASPVHIELDLPETKLTRMLRRI